MKARALACVFLMAAIALPYRAHCDTLSIGPSASDAGTMPQILILPGGKQPDTDLAASPPRLKAGEATDIVFTVTNNSKKPAKYNFLTAQRFDVSVRDGKGNEVWRWAEGRAFANNIGYLALTPGQSAVFHASWTGLDRERKPLPPGDYVAVAYLTPDQRSAITGGVLVNPVSDPNNLGRATTGRVESGSVRQINATPTVYASTKIRLQSGGE